MEPLRRRGHPRVFLIAVDGADPAIPDRLIAAGRLPTFARFRQEGAYARLRSREPTLSPTVWTTIATGQKPQDHSVLDFVEAAPDVPFDSQRQQSTEGARTTTALNDGLNVVTRNRSDVEKAGVKSTDPVTS